jgi:uncharacterized membrane protein (GlpM family)
MGGTIVQIALKAVAGGLFVLAFAALAEMLAPKRLAGVLSAAPSVALGSLLVTALVSGEAGMRAAAEGMLAGAVAFTAYCLVAAPLLEPWGTWRSTFTALAAWLLVAAACFLAVP